MNITFIFMLFAILNATVHTKSTILQDPNEEASNYEPKFCSLKLVNVYTGGDDYGNRKSTIPSELQQKSCSNFEDSCCSDEQFELMTNKAVTSLKNIYSGLTKFKAAIRLLSKTPENKFTELLTAVGPEYLETKEMTRDQSLGFFRDFKKNWKTYIVTIDKTFVLIQKFSSGLNCSICEAANHSNFTNIEKDSDVKMKLDINFCSNFFNAPEFFNLVDLLSQLDEITYMNQLLAKVYEVPSGEIFKQADEVKENILKERIRCLASDNIANDHQCLELCLETGKFNQFLLKEKALPFALFSILVNDYFGDQSALSEVNKPEVSETSENPEIRVLNAEERIEEFVGLWEVSYILGPEDEESEINLNRMKVVPTFGEGWNLENVRYTKWKTVFEGQAIISSVILFIFALNLTF